MTSVRGRLLGLAMLATAWREAAAPAAETLAFSTLSAGVNKSIDEWGYDTAWPSYDNARLSILTFGGTANVDVVRVNFHEFEALQADGSLGPQGKAVVDDAAWLAKLAGNKPISLTPDTGAGTASWYLDPAGGVSVDRYAALIKSTARYLSTAHGLSVGAVEVWNEPDYWPGQPTAGQVGGIIATLRADPLLANADMVGPSTLSPNTWWYDQIAGSVNVGSTHKLGGSAFGYIDFIQRVRSTGDAASNPEPHGLAEVIMGAEYGISSAIWWGPALNARGQFVQASDGVRLGYAENRGTETAAAVYRGPTGTLQAFTGGFERQGTSTAYRLVSTDRDVYFNGIGPIREYMTTATRDVQGGFTDITFGSDAIGQGTSLDGNRWTIVNRGSGQVLQVAGDSLVNGGAVNAATDTGGLAQRWNVRRSEDGYYTVLNANSGIALDLANASLADGGVAQQWGAGDALPQVWTIETAGQGAFFLRNGNSGKYLTGSPARAYQKSLDGSAGQQWQFVLSNPAPTGSLQARYDFQGNAADSAGSRHATITGAATYVAGPTVAEGTAVSFNGSSTYATLPAGVASSTDITLSTWVKWNGGGSWQRIFDFGNDTNSYLFLTPSSGDGTMRFAITTASGTGEQILETSALPTNQWVHLAVTLSGNTGVLYVDGGPRVAGRITLDPSSVNPTRNYLGKSQYADPLFNGVLDDFRIYDYALSRADVANLVPVSHYAWTGGVDSRWTTATVASPKNWKLTFNAAATDYADSDTIVFDDTAAVFTVRTDGDVRPLVTTFHNATAYTLTGSAGIAGTGTLVKNGLGSLTIANRNSYTGGTTINTGTVTLTGVLAGTPVTVDAAVFTETSAGAISGTAAFVTHGLTSLAGSNQLGMVRASGPGTMTIAGGTTSMTSATVGDTPGDRATLVVIGGNLVVSNTLAIGVAGSGSLTLQSGGTLATRSLIGGGGSSTVVFAGGVLRPLASGTAFLGGVTQALVRTGGCIIDTNGFDVTVSQPLLHDPILGGTADGGIVKRGAGTLTLSGSSSYSGPTTVNAGRLTINGSLAGSTVVNSGGIVSGTGTLRTVLVFRGGMLAPGIAATTGTMWLGGNLTLAAGSALSIELAASTAAVVGDSVAATGDVAISGGVLDLALPADLAPAWLASQQFVSGRSLAGAFARIGGMDLGGGRRLAVTYTASSARVTVAAAGDINIDGSIDMLDTAAFVSGGLFGVGSGGTWDRGDFNGDGLVDLLDASVFLTSGMFNRGSYAEPTLSMSSVVAVPEPAAATLLAAAVVACVTVAGGRGRWLRSRPQ
ncbi:MAG: LamG-like jellyroll fold domain-containing protein [Pirellulales bacterium]